MYEINLKGWMIKITSSKIFKLFLGKCFSPPYRGVIESSQVKYCQARNPTQRLDRVFYTLEGYAIPELELSDVIDALQEVKGSSVLRDI